MIAACSGGAGDLVYAIPIMRKLGVETIYVKENFYHPPHGNLYQTMKRFIESQGFQCKPTSGNYPVGKFDPYLKFDYNIDNWRQQRGRGRIFIQDNIAAHFGVTIDKDPWLNISGDQQDYTLIHLTPRWREGSNVNWAKILMEMKGPKKFIGFQYEWVEFCQRYGSIEWCPTDDIYDMACLIKGAKALYCNQSVALTLAQGLGVNYFCEFKPGKTNCKMQTKYEHSL